MLPISRLSVLLLGLVAIAPVAGAQVLEPPARPTRGLLGGGPPPDPTRTRQELTFGGNLLGGYDDNLNEAGVGDMFTPRPSGSLAFGEANLHYLVGTQTRFLELAGRGYFNAYQHSGLGTNYGADQSVAGRTPLGRKTNLAFGESVRYAPFFSLAVFGPLDGVRTEPSPDVNPTNGITATRTWANDLSASLTRTWTRRLETDVAYTFRRQTYEGNVGADGTAQAVTVGLLRSFGRSTGVRATYSHARSEYAGEGDPTQVFSDDTAELGLTYQRNLSRTRRIALSGGGGALRARQTFGVAGESFEYTSPSGYGSVRVDVGHSYSVSADYRRSLSVLQASTAQSFVTHSAILSVGGFLNSRLETVASAGYANGQAGQSPEVSEIGMYDGYTGTLRLRIRVSRGWSSVVSVSHYQYDLNAVASRVLSVSPEMHRNSVRAGLAWSLPLYGSSAPARR
jgi:hypothetical protein